MAHAYVQRAPALAVKHLKFCFHWSVKRFSWVSAGCLPPWTSELIDSQKLFVSINVWVFWFNSGKLEASIRCVCVICCQCMEEVFVPRSKRTISTIEVPWQNLRLRYSMSFALCLAMMCCVCFALCASALWRPIEPPSRRAVEPSSRRAGLVDWQKLAAIFNLTAKELSSHSCLHSSLSMSSTSSTSYFIDKLFRGVARGRGSRWVSADIGGG